MLTVVESIFQQRRVVSLQHLHRVRQHRSISGPRRPRLSKHPRRRPRRVNLILDTLRMIDHLPAPGTGLNLERLPLVRTYPRTRRHPGTLFPVLGLDHAHADRLDLLIALLVVVLQCLLDPFEELQTLLHVGPVIFHFVASFVDFTFDYFDAMLLIIHLRHTRHRGRTRLTKRHAILLTLILPCRRFTAVMSSSPPRFNLTQVADVGVHTLAMDLAAFGLLPRARIPGVPDCTLDVVCAIFGIVLLLELLRVFEDVQVVAEFHPVF